MTLAVVFGRAGSQQREVHLGNHAASSATFHPTVKSPNYTTWLLAKDLNMAIRASFPARPSDTFHNDSSPLLKAHWVWPIRHSMTPTWRGELLKEDKPMESSAHLHLSPRTSRMAGLSLPTDPCPSNHLTKGNGKTIIEADLVDCMVALPGRFFYATQFPSVFGSSPRKKSEDSLPPRRNALNRPPKS